MPKMSVMSANVPVIDAFVTVDVLVTVTLVVEGDGVTVTIGVLVDRIVTPDVVLFVLVELGTGEREVAPYLVLQSSVVVVVTEAEE